MNLLTRLVCSTVMLRAGSNARRTSMSSTLAVFREKRRPTKRLRDKSRARSANLSKSERLCKVVMKMLRSLRVKSPSWLISSQLSPLSFSASVVPFLTSTKFLKRRWSVSRPPRESTQRLNGDFLMRCPLKINLNQLIRALRVNSKSLKAI